MWSVIPKPFFSYDDSPFRIHDAPKALRTSPNHSQKPSSFADYWQVNLLLQLDDVLLLCLRVNDYHLFRINVNINDFVRHTLALQQLSSSVFAG